MVKKFIVFHGNGRNNFELVEEAPLDEAYRNLGKLEPDAEVYYLEDEVYKPVPESIIESASNYWSKQ